MKQTAKIVDVPGGSLRYRWLPVSSGPVLVFENGWGVSLEQWAWVERELAGKASLLFYSHAGIGGSTLSQEQTPEGISLQLVALLDSLGISRPVVLVGHSFGGLMSALHAAQQPARIAGIVQLDNTQEVADATLDKPLGWVKWLCAMASLCARLGIPDPVFGGLARTLPPEEGARLAELSFRSPASFRAALAELDLVPDIRAAIAAAPPAQPRLVISADRLEPSPGLLSRLLLPRAKLSERLRRIHQLHRAQAAAIGSRWMTLPHDHGGLVFTAAGAADSAGALWTFAQRISAKPALQAVS